MKTKKQAQQWTRFNSLGTLVGLSRWIVSAESRIVKMNNVSEYRRAMISRLVSMLSDELLAAARELGWKGFKK